jgi:hypothetical protein
MKIKVIRENSKVRAYELALGNERTKYSEYDWAKTLKKAAQETGTNALRLRLYLYGWRLDGQRDELYDYEMSNPGDVREAIALAQTMVKNGALSVQIEGEARRTFAMRGFGDRAVFRIAEVRRDTK